MTAVQKAAYGDRLQASANQWLPTVRRMRPDYTWDDIARVLKERGHDWTPERLRQRREVAGCGAHGRSGFASQIPSPSA